MKAAMQAAMELEGRLETIETAFEAFQQRFDAFQGTAALKADLEAFEERESAARRDLLVAVAKKADLEQLGQCLQAVRHELGEVVKRKANSELVDSNLQDLRRELLGLLEQQRSGLGELKGQTEAWHREVAGELQGKAAEAGQRALEEQLLALQAVASEAAQRSDLDRVEGFLEKQLPALLQQKAEAEAVQRLETEQAQLGEQLRGKAAAADLQAVHEAAGRKADAEQLAQNLQALRQEVLRSLQCKVNTDFMEQRLQAAEAAQAANLQETQEKLSLSLQAKADTSSVDRLVQDFQDVGQKLEDLTSTKADREKVVEIVEAVRDEVIEMAKQRPDFEEQFTSDLAELSEQVKAKAEESRVEMRLGLLRQDVVNMVVDKADIELVSNRVWAAQQSMAEQVAQEVRVVRDELTTLIGHKVDMDLMDRRLQTLQQEVTEALKARVARRRSSSKEAAEGFLPKGLGKKLVKDGQYIPEDEEDCGSEVTTTEGWGDRMSEAPTMSDMEEWMDHRMKLVKIELTKLVDTKADSEHVSQGMKAMREEVVQHVEQRVQVAQQSLSDHLSREAQAVRQELKADVNMLTQCMTEVERTFEYMQGDKPFAIKNFHEALHGKPVAQAEPPAPPAPPAEEAAAPAKPAPQRDERAAQPGRSKEAYSPDDFRTRRVRDLLTQLVVPEGQQQQ